MTNIGLPSINIAFKEMASTVIARGNTGIVAMILKDATNLGLIEITNALDIPSGLSDANKKYIELALLGNVTTPSKVKAYVLGASDTTQSALDFLESVEFNYLVMPTAIESDKASIKTFVGKMRSEIKNRVKAVLSNTDADSEGIVNVTENNVTMKHGKVNSDVFTCVIGGLICGTPLSQSVTYAVPKEVLDIEAKTKAQAENSVKNGELVLIKEANKIRVARGVNSLTTTTAENGELFCKIKLVDTMDLIHNDIRKVCVDRYIGKVSNNYMNKLVLIGAIKGYLDELVLEQLIEADFTVEIDIDAQRTYLKSLGVNVNEMNEQQIKEANTRDKVFLKASVKLIDSMESISLDISL